MNIPNKLTLNDDRAGVDISFDPAFFANRKILLMMGDRALYLAFNHEVLVS